MSALRVKFRTAVVVNEKPPYTMYEIEVRTSIYENPWILHKRFSDFYKLHSQLQKLKLNALNGLSIPPRRLVRSRAVDVIHRRKHDLEKYLQSIIKIDELLNHKLVFDFLQIPQESQWLLLSKNNNNHNNNNNNSSNKQNWTDERERFEYEINTFLKQLSFQRNSVKVIQKFEDYYFKQQTKTRYRDFGYILYDQNKINSTALIKELFIGNDINQGLIHSCRLLHSKVASRAAITLLYRLLDRNWNGYADRFRQIFAKIDISLYREMYLHQHIYDEATKNYAFKIIQIIQEILPELDMKMYVNDDTALNKYLQWNKKQQIAFVNVTTVNDDGMNIQTKLNETGFDWNKMRYKEISECIFESFGILSNESDDEYQRVLTNTMMDKRLNVRYKKDIESKQWKMKVSFVIDHPAKIVYDYIVYDMMNNNTSSWNTKIMEQKMNKLLDKNHFIVHQTFSSFNSQDKFMDFVLLTCLKVDYVEVETMRYMILFSSINNYNDLYIQKGNKDRAILLPSGFEICSVKNDENKCIISYIAHMTKTSILTMSADLLGETDEFFKALFNIEQLISDE